jgi:hypothetical protein
VALQRRRELRDRPVDLRGRRLHHALKRRQDERRALGNPLQTVAALPMISDRQAELRLFPAIVALER